MTRMRRTQRGMAACIGFMVAVTAWSTWSEGFLRVVQVVTVMTLVALMGVALGILVERYPEAAGSDWPDGQLRSLLRRRPWTVQLRGLWSGQPSYPLTFLRFHTKEEVEEWIRRADKKDGVTTEHMTRWEPVELRSLPKNRR